MRCRRGDSENHQNERDDGGEAANHQTTVPETKIIKASMRATVSEIGANIH